MKILIDLTSLADHLSGIERYAACLTLEMLKKENITYILVFKKNVHPLFLSWIENERVEIIVLPECKKLLFNQFRLPIEIYKHKADWYLFMAFPAPIFLFKKNMVSTIHDICCWDYPETMTTLSKWYFRVSFRSAALKCKFITTVSNFSKERIVTKLKCSKGKTFVIYSAVDKKFLQIEPPSTDVDTIKKKYTLPEHYFLSLSTLEPRKNLRLLIEAYQKLIIESGCDILLVLAGRKGWKIDKLLEGIDIQVKSHIHFTGFVDDEDLPVVYREAEFFVFTSKYEGFGLPPLEAMACGVPVLSSDAASMPEILGDTACYFRSEDVNSLFEKMQEMMTMTEEKRAQMIGCGLEQAKKFTWEKSSEKLKMMLESIT